MRSRSRQLCRRSGARQERVDRPQDVLSPGAARLVAPQGLQVGGLEGPQQRDDLLGPELVVLDPADRRRQPRIDRAPAARRHVLDRLGRAIAPEHTGAAAQELLDRTLVAVAVAVALADERREALLLAQLQDGLAR